MVGVRYSGKVVYGGRKVYVVRDSAIVGGKGSRILDTSISEREVWNRVWRLGEFSHVV